MPGNLGSYQTMVTLAKSVGGPKRLAVAVATAGFVVPRAVEAGVRGMGRRSAAASREPHMPAFHAGEHVLTCREVPLGGGVRLPSGAAAQVIEQDGDAVLITVVGRDDNPHVVTASALERAATTAD